MSEKLPMHILTGFKPTGTLHIGNYLGAFAPLLRLTEEHPDAKFLCLIADLHALNTGIAPADLRQYNNELVRTLMALDTNNRLIFYRSSRVSEIGQFATILANYIGKGFFNRAHAYLTRVAQNEELGRPIDDGVNMGLFTYPLLMGADILATGANVVPVGPDQAQHLEIAQQLYKGIVARIGKKTGLQYPTALVQTGVSVTGLDGRKMSKSYDNIIPLLGSERTRAVRRIATDSTPLGSPKDPDACQIMNIYRHFANTSEYAEMEQEYRAGTFSYGRTKQALSDALDALLDPVQVRYDALTETEIQERLLQGEDEVRARASSMLANVIHATGM